MMLGDILTAFFLLALWAGLHSLFMALPVKRFFLRLLGRNFAWYRLTFNVTSFLGLLAVLLAMPNLDAVIYRVQWPFSLAFYLLGLISILGLYGAYRQFDGPEFLGLKQVRQYRAGTYSPMMEDDPRAAPPLEVRGLYRMSRHPMYFFGILLLASRPVMDVRGVVLLVGAWAYFHVGSMHEERRLVFTYGKAYEDYRRQVSRIFPVRFVMNLFNKTTPPDSSGRSA